MEEMKQANLFINLDKKIIMEPGKLTLSGGSSVFEMGLIHPKWGNPFQYEVYQLLRKQWKGDRFALVEDTEEMRETLTKYDGFHFYRNYKEKFFRETRKEGPFIQVNSLDQRDMDRIQRKWEKFLNKYVIINYDSGLYMTIDQRLFKRTKSMMPFFFFILAHTEEQIESDGSWAADRVGIELIETDTLDKDEYVEMFRMIGDKSVCQLGVEAAEEKIQSMKVKEKSC